MCVTVLEPSVRVFSVLHNINPWSPLFSKWGGGDEGRESGFLRNWHHPPPPPSFQFWTPPPLYTLIFSLFAPFSAGLWLARSWWQSAQPLCQSQPTPLLPPSPTFSLFHATHNSVAPPPAHLARLTTEASHTFKENTHHQWQTAPTTLVHHEDIETHTHATCSCVQTLHLFPLILTGKTVSSMGIWITWIYSHEK